MKSLGPKTINTVSLFTDAASPAECLWYSLFLFQSPPLHPWSPCVLCRTKMPTEAGHSIVGLMASIASKQRKCILSMPNGSRFLYCHVYQVEGNAFFAYSSVKLSPSISTIAPVSRECTD